MQISKQISFNAGKLKVNKSSKTSLCDINMLLAMQNTTVGARCVGGKVPLVSPCGSGGAGSSGVASTASCTNASTAHTTPHMSHNHITTLHYLIIGTIFTQLNQYESLTILITSTGTIILWKKSCRNVNFS